MSDTEIADNRLLSGMPIDDDELLSPTPVPDELLEDEEDEEEDEELEDELDEVPDDPPEDDEESATFVPSPPVDATGIPSWGRTMICLRPWGSGTGRGRVKGSLVFCCRNPLARFRSNSALGLGFTE